MNFSVVRLRFSMIQSIKFATLLVLLSCFIGCEDSVTPPRQYSGNASGASVNSSQNEAEVAVIDVAGERSKRFSDGDKVLNQ